MIKIELYQHALKNGQPERKKLRNRLRSVLASIAYALAKTEAGGFIRVVHRFLPENQAKYLPGFTTTRESKAAFS